MPTNSEWLEAATEAKKLAEEAGDKDRAAAIDKDIKHYKALASKDAKAAETADAPNDAEKR